MPDAVAVLPDDVRGDLRDPLGPVYPDVATALAGAGEPIVAVGDVVTANLFEAGERPAVALVDGRTKREAVDPEIAAVLDELETHVTVENPAGTITAALVEALADALAREGHTLVSVEGEEDLAALPAVLLAPDGATVVYGQPDEGMVAVSVDDETRARVRELLGRFETEPELWALLGVDAP